MRELRLRMEWVAGRIRGGLSRALPLDLGGHCVPWWRWRTYREFYSGRSRRRRGAGSDAQPERE